AGSRVMGGRLDPTGLYRLAAVFDWMKEMGLTVDAIHDHVLALQALFHAEVARAKVKPLCDAQLVTPVAAGSARGHFLTFELANAQAIHDRLPRRQNIPARAGGGSPFGVGRFDTPPDVRAPGAR